MKKLFIIFFVITLFTSCGKKGDPTYNGKEKNFENTKLKVVS
tara:strand:+ start:325 stop:450 length:126 start_codon:yes stop_codon:yes gene_type:complete